MKIPARAGSPLDTLLGETGLAVVDVGARRRPVGELRALAQWAHLLAIEPDAAEAARLDETLRADGWRDVTVAAVAVGRPRRATLHVTAAPGFSSLLAPDVGVARRYATADKLRVTARQTLDVVGLDEVAGDLPAVTILKLDTQGTELDILLSGDETVARTAAVLVEMEFEPLYEGQPLFGDVDRHLRDRGFRLGDFELARVRSNGFRPELWSRKQAVWAHAAYIRDIGGVSEPLRAHLLAATLALGFIDLALQLVHAAFPQTGEDVEALAAARTRKVLERLPPEDAARGFGEWERA